MGVWEVFQSSDETIIGELKLYIEDWETFNIKNKSQLSCTMFLAKYGSLDLYDEDLEKIFIIYHEQLRFDKNSGCTLIGIPEKSDGIFLIMSIFAFMMIFLIEFYQLIKIEISCGSLYQTNQTRINIRVKQQRYRMERFKNIGGVLPKNQPSILFRERGKSFWL